MTVEIVPQSSRPLAMSCSISLGAIPAQATHMGADAKSELARAISKQVSKVLSGRYTSPADVISSSADLMAAGLAWCESTRVADGELVVALINGIMHFKFLGDAENGNSDHDGDGPDAPGPNTRPRVRETLSMEFVRLVSSALVEHAYVERENDNITRNQVMAVAVQLLASHDRQLERDRELEKLADVTGGIDMILNDLSSLVLGEPSQIGINDPPISPEEIMPRYRRKRSLDMRRQWLPILTFGVPTHGSSHGEHPCANEPAAIRFTATSARPEHLGSIDADSDAINELLPFLVSSAGNRSVGWNRLTPST